MLRRFGLLFLLIFVAVTVFAQVSAPPRDQTQAAVLADMSRRTGETVTINSLGYQQWHYGTYEYVRGLGCPASPQAPSTSGNWQRFVFNYRGFDYIYLISDNLQALILCNEANLPTAIAPTAQATATQQGTGQSGGGVAATATPTVTSGDFGNLPTATLQGSGQSGGGFAVSATPVTGGSGDAGNMPTPDLLNCPLLPRLSAFNEASVSPGEPNWLHDEASRSSTKIGEIPAGMIVRVLAGPVCDEATNMNYWQVNYDGVIGWTSEGLDGEYWLEPIVNRFSASSVNAAFVPAWANNIPEGALLAFSQQRIAYTSSPNQIELIQHNDNVILESLTMSDTVTDLDFQRSDSILTIGLANGELHIAEFAPNLQITHRYMHEGAVTAVAISGDGTILAVADDAGILSFWYAGLEDNPLRRVQLPVVAGDLEFSADSRLLLLRDLEGNFLTALQVP